MRKTKPKGIFRKIIASLPAGIPHFGPVYAQLLAQLSSEEQSALLIELKEMTEDQLEALSQELQMNMNQIDRMMKLLEDIIQSNLSQVKEIAEMTKAYLESQSKQLLILLDLKN